MSFQTFSDSVFCSTVNHECTNYFYYVKPYLDKAWYSVIHQGISTITLTLFPDVLIDGSKRVDDE
jgi:hypothetical protein